MERIPIENARNLGPISAAEMSSIGIEYLDQIEKMGWEDFCILYTEHYPKRLNLNAFTAIIGALEDTDWRKVSPEQKQQARSLIASIKKGNVY